LSEADDSTRQFMTQAVLALSDAAVPGAAGVRARRLHPGAGQRVPGGARPGKNVVYLGCALLILGVFAMLYIRERRLWVWLTPGDAGGTRHDGAVVQPQDAGSRSRIRTTAHSLAAPGRRGDLKP
jgi:cytochrome c biogenesis protein